VGGFAFDLGQERQFGARKVHPSRAGGAPYSVSMMGEGPPLDHGDKVASADDLRASHEDRDRVAVAVRSGRVKVRAPRGSEVPVILRIEVSGRVGSGRLKVRPARRTFRQWLLRRPRPY